MTGLINQHRNSQFFQFILYFRSMADHGGFHCQRAVFPQDPFVIRFAVLTGVEHIALLHRRSGAFNIPAISIRTGKPDYIHSVQSIKQTHGRCGCQIDILNGLL